MKYHGKLEGLKHEDQDVEGTVTQLQLELAFDGRLKELASVKKEHMDSFSPAQRRKFYFIVVPVCQAPAWCLDYYRAANERHFGAFDCDTVSAETGIMYSAFPTFSPLLTILIDVACLVVLCVMAIYENKYRD